MVSKGEKEQGEPVTIVKSLVISNLSARKRNLMIGLKVNLKVELIAVKAVSLIIATLNIVLVIVRVYKLIKVFNKINHN